MTVTPMEGNKDSQSCQWKQTKCMTTQPAQLPSADNIRPRTAMTARWLTDDGPKNLGSTFRKRDA